MRALLQRIRSGPRAKSLRSYAAFMITGITALALAVTGVFFYAHTARTLRETYQEQMYQQLNNTMSQIGEQVELMDSLYPLFMSNNLIYDSLEAASADSYSTTAIERQMTYLLITNYAWNLILSVYYYEDLAPVLENCREIVRIPEQLYSMKVFVGVSGLHHGVAEFSTATFEAIHTLSLTFYSPSSIAALDPAADRSENILPAEDTMSLYELENAIRQRDFQAASAVAGALFLKLKSNFVNENDAKSICSHIYYLTFRVLAKSSRALPPEEYLARIGRAADIFQLEDIVKELLAFAREELTSSDREYSGYVQEAITYIREHPADELTLDDIAQHTHMNSSYLSRIFKKECGCSVTEYITTIRMEKAKELLETTNLLTYEIAEQIGINEPSYFSMLFKKHAGLTPTEYRSRFR